MESSSVDSFDQKTTLISLVPKCPVVRLSWQESIRTVVLLPDRVCITIHNAFPPSHPLSKHWRHFIKLILYHSHSVAPSWGGTLSCAAYRSNEESVCVKVGGTARAVASHWKTCGWGQLSLHFWHGWLVSQWYEKRLLNKAVFLTMCWTNAECL